MHIKWKIAFMVVLFVTERFCDGGREVEVI